MTRQYNHSLCRAEDGIRDGHVSGVQTCALPISGGDQCCHDGVVAPDLATRSGRRDYAIMATLIATGLRVGELTEIGRAACRERVGTSTVVADLIRNV